MAYCRASHEQVLCIDLVLLATRTNPLIQSFDRRPSPRTRNDDVFDDVDDDSDDDALDDDNSNDNGGNDDDDNIVVVVVVAIVARYRSCPRYAGVARGCTSRDRHHNFRRR